LNDAGHSAARFDMRVDRYRSNSRDHAKDVAMIMKDRGITRALLAGSSRAGDVMAWIPYFAPDINFEGRVFMASAFDDNTLASFPEAALAEGKNIPRNSDDFKNGIKPLNRYINPYFGVREGELGYTFFDEEKAPDVFFNRCNPEVQKWATDLLRLQWRGKESALRYWHHDIPSVYLHGSEDKAVLPEWGAYRARLLGTEQQLIDGADHSLQLSATDEVVRAIDELVRAAR
jgi:pimeloyl-ACP methyl ester carboxylesterase